MADTKSDLARAGTMQVTAKDGKVFLEKNLTEWKKPYLTDHFDDGEEEEEEEAPAPAKAKLSKHTTMKGTAKEAESLLAGGKPDADALTRGQQKKIEEIQSETPAAKKAKMARAGTMAVTAKEGKQLLEGEKLGDTRTVTKARGRKPAVGRTTTIAKTKAEAEAVYGDLSATTGRRTRSANKTPDKPAVKRAGTMQNTAKEGKAYLKRGKKAAKKAKQEAEEEEEVEEEED